MLPGWNGEKAPRTDIQSMIDQMIDGFHEQDRLAGNTGGLDVIKCMVQFFNHRRPPDKYQDMEDFLQYRREDAPIP